MDDTRRYIKHCLFETQSDADRWEEDLEKVVATCRKATEYAGPNPNTTLWGNVLDEVSTFMDHYGKLYVPDNVRMAYQQA